MMKIKTSIARVFARITALLLLCPLLLAGCIGQKSQSFITSVGSLLSAPFLNINLSASYSLSEEACAVYGGLLPLRFTLTAEGGATENISEYYLNIYLKQPSGQREALLYIYGSDGDMYVQAQSYPYLLPELLYYMEYINSFEYEHLKEVLESGTALKIDTASLLSFLTEDNNAVMFLEQLLDEHSNLNYSALYSSLAALASDSVDNMSGALVPSSFGAGWVRYKADGAALYSAIEGALEQLSENAQEASENLEDFLKDSRSSFSAGFLEECERARVTGGFVPDFGVYEDMRFDVLLEDASDTAEGLSALSLALRDRLSEKQSFEDDAGIKTGREITLSGSLDKFWLMVSTVKKQGFKAYMSSEFKLTVTRGNDFKFTAVKFIELEKVMWEAARDFYKSDEHKAVFLNLDYNSMTATVRTVSQELLSYPIEGLTQDYFNAATHGGTDTPEHAAIVPVRLACEIFGEDVKWDASSERAYVARMTGEGEKRFYISGSLCGGKLFAPVKELYKLDIVCFGENIYGFELAR